MNYKFKCDNCKTRFAHNHKLKEHTEGNHIIYSESRWRNKFAFKWTIKWITSSNVIIAKIDSLTVTSARSQRERPCDHCITEFTRKYRLKDHKEKTMWSVYNGIHKQIQIERSQREDHLISVWQNSQTNTDWKITKRKPYDQYITEVTSKYKLEDQKERDHVIIV